MDRSYLPPDLEAEFVVEPGEGPHFKSFQYRDQGWKLESDELGPLVTRREVIRWNSGEEERGEFIQRWIARIQEQRGFARECAFCAKQQHEVARLIAGPSVMICNECVELCSEIMAEAGGHD